MKLKSRHKSETSAKVVKTWNWWPSRLNFTTERQTEEFCIDTDKNDFFLFKRNFGPCLADGSFLCMNKNQKTQLCQRNVILLSCKLFVANLYRFTRILFDKHNDHLNNNFYVFIASAFFSERQKLNSTQQLRCLVLFLCEAHLHAVELPAVFYPQLERLGKADVI